MKLGFKMFEEKFLCTLDFAEHFMFFRLDGIFTGFRIGFEVKTGLILLKVVRQGEHRTGLFKVLVRLGRWG